MPKFKVTIEARVTKTLEIEAATESEARAEAYESFSACNDEQPERYVENIINLVEA